MKKIKIIAEEEKKSKFENQKAGTFYLLNENNEEVCMRDLIGKKRIILFFFPKTINNNTILESKGFSHLRVKLKNRDTVIFGISQNTTKKHLDFIKKENIKVNLLSDKDSRILKKYGALIEDGKKQLKASRDTFLISKEGIILKHWNKVRSAGHPEMVLTFIKEIDKEKKNLEKKQNNKLQK